MGNKIYYRINFNPRIREGCDRLQRTRLHNPRNFNPRIHEDATRPPTSASAYRDVFQSTHPRGMRPRATSYIPARSAFQSTHPRGMRLSYDGSFSILDLFQSTHPRGMRLQESLASLYPEKISIHASARDATLIEFYRRGRLVQISIHASARDATASNTAFNSSPRNFNPRIREGCDDIDFLNTIHGLFQSTHPRGMRHYLGSILFPAKKFQSTHPRGMRP